MKQQLGIVCGIVLAGWLAGAAMAAPQSTWWLEPATLQLTVGATAEVEVYLAAGEAIPAASVYSLLQADLRWQTTALAVNGVTPLAGWWTGGTCGEPASMLALQNVFSSGRLLASQQTVLGTEVCDMQREPFALWRVEVQGVANGWTNLSFGPLTRLVYETSPQVSEDVDFATTSAWINVYDPALADADGDFVGDSVEAFPAVTGRTNAWLPDSDGDGLDDGYEDADRDGIVDEGETSPLARDTDGDGLTDGVEVNVVRSDPLDAQSPGTLTDQDADELPAAVDPDDGQADTDGDHYSDGYEAAMLGLAAVGDDTLHPQLGDVSNDGAVSNMDALMVLSVFVGLTAPWDVGVIGRGDVTRDGRLTNLDALVLQAQFMDGVPLPLPGL